MSHSAWKSGTAVLIALGITSGAVAPMIAPAPSFAQSSFPDVPSNYWAAGFIQELVNRGVIAGFPDGSFRPEEPVTRAQYASMVRKAFPKSPIRSGVQFVDVPSNYWAASAIQEAYSTGFLAGYPGNVFRPGENIPRAQVLVSLSNGLNYATTGQVDSVLLAYNDAANIPGYARPSIAAATEKRIVVNYPDVSTLAPNQVATRAEVAAFIYQALVSQGQVAGISSPYIVGQAPTPQPQAVRIPAGASIPVRSDNAERILLAKNETNPTPFTLKVAQNIVNSRGDVLIPAGSLVNGELRVNDGAAKFFGNQLVLPNGRQLQVNATSNAISTTESIRQGTSLGKVLTGAVLGSAAAAGVAGVTGDRTIKAGEVLIGTGVGAIAGAILNGRLDLISVNPNTDLNLTLNSDLVIGQ
ncbi:MAG TPA: S-layer homology domain-containing protein [Thermosynechococcaceae cyanobacterium]